MGVSKPFFSVVIPTLNEEKYLPSLLGDLRLQIDKDFEVFVVDSKSEDKTVSVAREFESLLPSLKVEVLGVKNVSKQRNYGAKKAIGNYLVFFDADVRLPKNFLSELHYHLDVREKGCKFLTTWCEPDSVDQVDRLIVNLANVGMEVGKVLEKPMVGGFNIIVDRTVFLKVGGFDEDWVPGKSEDFDLARRLLKARVELQIIKSPKLVTSLRRYRREGTLTALRKHAKGISMMLFSDNYTNIGIDYQMGGGVKPTKQKVRQLSQLSLENFMKLLKGGW